MGQGIPPYSNYLCRSPYIPAVDTILNVFSYDAVSGRNSNLSPPQRRAGHYVLATVASTSCLNASFVYNKDDINDKSEALK